MKQLFKEALNVSTNKLMSLEDIINSSNQDVINDQLQCPTPGCPVRLKLIRSKTAYLRALPHQAHIDGCPYAPKTSTKVYTNGQRLAVNLNSEQITRRLKALAKEAFDDGKTSKQQPKRNKPRKSVNIDNHKPKAGVKYSPNAKSSQLGSGRHTPHILHLKPNEIRKGDERKAFQGYGIITGFTKTNEKNSIPHYRIKIKDPQNHSELFLEIKDSYFQRFALPNLDDGMVDFIKDYSANHQLMLGFVATITDGTNKIAEIKRDFDIKVFIYKGNAKCYSFREFYAIVTHTFGGR